MEVGGGAVRPLNKRQQLRNPVLHGRKDCRSVHAVKGVLQVKQKGRGVVVLC